VACNIESMVHFLLSKGADVNYSQSMVSLLFMAIRSASESIVRLLISHRADVEPTVLHYAVRVGRSDVIRTLCELGVDSEAKDYAHQTPLHTACKDPDLVRVLLEFGADLEAQDYRKHTIDYSTSRCEFGSGSCCGP
jgi:ankyrin repeat protein